MANLKIINTFKDEFKEKLELNKNKLIFDIKGANLIEKDKYEGDLTKLVSCSENYYEDLIKIYSNNEYVIELAENSKLEIDAIGIIYIIIKKNITLEIDFNSQKFNAIYLKLLIKENCNVKLVENIKTQNLYKNIKIILEKNAKLEHGQIIENCKYCDSKVILNNDSKYVLKTAAVSKKNDYYIKNQVQHIGRESKSDMKIKCFAFNESKIITDGLIKIEKNGNNCISHLKIDGFILDINAKIYAQPILEIENNDIECSHAAGISRINPNKLYYLESRGISAKNAINMIIDGAIEEIREIKK